MAFLSIVGERLLHLLQAPLLNTEMIWIISPLIFTLLIMNFYFGIHKREELGWNTAVGNSLALIFVSMDLFRHIYTNSAGKTIMEIIFGNFREVVVVGCIAMISFWLLFGEFFHLIPKQIAFLVSSSLPTTLIAYMGIILIYTNVPLDFITFLAGILMLIVLSIFFSIVHFLEPFHMEEEDRLKLFKK